MSFLLNREFSNGQLASSSYGRVIQTVVDTGVPSEDRTGTGTLGVSYVPSYYMLTGGAVPLISSKQVNLKPLLVELEWYLQGSGNIGFLKEHGVKIWDAWADDNGDLGPVYGKQWRRWEDTRIVPYSEYRLKEDIFLERGYRVEGYIGLNEDRVVITREIDQLQRMVDQLRNDPTDRRILLNAWNVGELEDMKLPPCHFVLSVWSRELDFQTRLSMATDIGIQHNRHGYESIYTQMLCLIEQRGSISEPMLDELGIPKRILNSCLVQRVSILSLVCHSILPVTASSRSSLRRLRVTWLAPSSISALMFTFTTTTWSRLKSYWLANIRSRPTPSSSSRTNGKSWMTSNGTACRSSATNHFHGLRLQWRCDMARGMYVLCEIEDVLARAGHRKAAADENADTLVAGDELIFPTSRMLRGFARSGAEVVLISHRPEALESATKKWLRDFGIDYDWLHLAPGGVNYETHIKRTLAAHKDDLMIAALVSSSRLRAALSGFHQRPVLYEVSQ